MFRPELLVGVKTGIYFFVRVDLPVEFAGGIKISGILSFVPSSSDTGSLTILIVLAKVDFDVTDAGFYYMTPIYPFDDVTLALPGPAFSFVHPYPPPLAVILGYPL